MADNNAEGPVARVNGAARLLADDSAEGPLAGGAARPVAGAAGEGASNGLCGKRCGNHNSKTPQTSPREWVESSAVWKTVWKSEFQNTTKSIRELVESSAVWENVWKP